MATGRKDRLSFRALDRISTLLERVVPWIRRVERPATVLAVAGAVAVLWLVVLIVRGTDIGSAVEWLALIVSAAVLAVPVGVLGLFVLSLRQIVELPGQLRALPQTSKDQAARFAAAMNTLRQPRQSGVRGSVVGLWQVRGALFELAGLAEPVMGIVGLVRLPFLLLVVFAVLIVCVEILIAVVAFALVVVL